MVFNALFGSRLIPHSLRRVATAPRSSAIARTSPLRQMTVGGASTPAMGSVSPMMRSTLSASRPLSPLSPLSPSSLQLSVRCYGTRSLWNVKSGRVWFTLYVGGFMVCAAVVQEILGPYMFFHE
mmetsp:Transcript_44975/g.97695  ORF Transcript_44975/g.97695 Transcript_44975/m.97695 type:complete len:124 (+) Transcript_44975:67-438(+)|eukprot:CAMPEP_0170600016 /NCGR_PEP_ID=MMETSP0224-20130122/17111_1 /TAXON_ID=285029 /ORGANISM="Togula jolla, Strain CCCM 725" /LENGTH=123 /DNA_ID=CAMNT_0010924717 /DNA_START=66 /DNA_END=437 /DNA_ORIENTATION=+